MSDESSGGESTQADGAPAGDAAADNGIDEALPAGAPAEQRLALVTRAYRAQRDELAGLHDLIDAFKLLLARSRAIGISANDLLHLNTTLTALCSATVAEGGAVLAVDEERSELVFAAAEGPDADKLLWERLGAGVGIAGWVARERRTAIVNSPTSDERFYRGIDSQLGRQTRSVIAAPIESGSRLLGVLELVNKGGGKLFSRRDEALVELTSHHLGQFLGHLAAQGNPASSIVQRP